MYVCVLVCVGVYTHACGNHRLSFFFGHYNNWRQVILSSALPSVAGQIDPENFRLCVPRPAITCWIPYFLSFRDDFQIQTSVFVFVLHTVSSVTHLLIHKNQISVRTLERINYIQIRAILSFTCLLWYLKGKKRYRMLIFSAFKHNTLDVGMSEFLSRKQMDSVVSKFRDPRLLPPGKPLESIKSRMQKQVYSFWLAGSF